MQKPKKILCDLYIPSSNYVQVNSTEYTHSEIANCARCEYWEGTKCQDIHNAVAANEKRHAAYTYMMLDNRGINM